MQMVIKTNNTNLKGPRIKNIEKKRLRVKKIAGHQANEQKVANLHQQISSSLSANSQK
uniref:Uncharacterized protein n=1 Tax=Arion vulgaris TaxID=1028688 RepID=A0A0B7A8X5_9EUPU